MTTKAIIVKRLSGTTTQQMDADRTICGIPLDMVKAVALDGESFIYPAKEFICIPSNGHLGKQTGHLGKQTLDKKMK